MFLLCALFLASAHHAAVARPAQTSGVTQFTAQITPVDPLNRFNSNPRNYSLSESNSLWSIITRDNDGDGFVDYVQIQIYMLESQDGLGQGYIWFLTFSSERLGRPLAPGHFPNAMRAGSETEGRPGLEIARGGCSLTGEFTILEARYGSEIRFAASFRQQCDGFTGARTGTVYFRYGGTPAIGLSVLNTSPLTDALVGSQYTKQLDAFGGFPPYFWSIAAGELPPGLVLSPAGSLNGTPTLPGNFVFIAQATDTSPAVGLPTQAATARLEINVRETPGPLLITEAAPPNAAKGVSYDYRLLAEGGSPPYTWSVVEGQVPPGLHLTADGHLIGNPNAAGTFDFIVQAADSGGKSTRREYSMRVVDPPQITKVKYKGGNGKMTIIGQGFAELAMLFVDDRQLAPKSQDSTSFVVKKLFLVAGAHQVRVVNPDGGIADTLLIVK